MLPFLENFVGKNAINGVSGNFGICIGQRRVQEVQKWV